MDLCIVGIDPGTTSAVAVLDFEGRPAALLSKKEYALSVLLLDIMEHGTPIVIGCDKRRVPSLVGVVATKTGARVSAPSQDMLHAEKKEVLGRHNLGPLPKNQHEWDALACALAAFEAYAPLFQKIKRLVEKKGRPQDLRPLVLAALQHEEVNITDLLRSLNAPPPRPAKPKRRHTAEMAPPSKILRDLEASNSLLSAQVEALKVRIAELEIRATPRRPKREPTGQRWLRTIRRLQSQLQTTQDQRTEKMGELAALSAFIARLGGRRLFKVLENLSDAEWRAKAHLGVQRGDWVLVRNPDVATQSVVARLAALECRVLALRGPRRDLGLAVHPTEGLAFEFCGGFASAPAEEAQRRLDSHQVFTKVLEEYKRKRQEELDR